MVAGEKGMDIQTMIFDPESSEVQRMSPFGVGPIIQHVDHVVVGHRGIISYFDDKGFGISLFMRNGVVRSSQMQWIDYAAEVLHQNMENDEVLEKCFSELNKKLEANSRMGGNRPKEFICGEFSTADVYWGACANLLSIKGRDNYIKKHGAVATWWNKVKSHPSSSKENLTPYDCMPTREDIESNKLRNVAINVLK